MRVGSVAVPDGTLPGPDDQDRIDADPVRCADPTAAAAMLDEIDTAQQGR